MNEQMRHLVAALYQHSALVPQVAVPSEVFRRLVEVAMVRPAEVEDAKIIKEKQ
jgi:Mor family transcriptional regulator